MALRRGLQKAGQSLLRGSTGQARSHAIRGLVTFSLPDLPYDYGELQPVISARIMELHHSKHHAAYVTNFNKASEAAAEAELAGDVAKTIALHSAIKFNGGGASSPYACYQDAASPDTGHVNHDLFWKNLIPPKARHTLCALMHDANPTTGLCTTLWKAPGVY